MLWFFKSRIEICKYKTVGTCCVSGSVTIDWMVERSGYVPGESIIVHGEVQNECRAPVVYCKTVLYMVRSIAAESTNA